MSSVTIQSSPVPALPLTSITPQVEHALGRVAHLEKALAAATGATGRSDSDGAAGLGLGLGLGTGTVPLGPLESGKPTFDLDVAFEVLNFLTRPGSVASIIALRMYSLTPSPDSY